MRILTLRLGDRPPLELHRKVTVLGGLDDATRRDVVGALAALARGKAGDGVTAELEAHGILLDAVPPTLDALGLPADIEPVIHGDDLPGGREAIRARAAAEALAAAEAELAGRAAEHREAVAAVEEAAPAPPPDTDALRHALESATTRRIGAEAALADLRTAHREAIAGLEAAAVTARERAEAARAALDQRPVADPEPVAAALEALETALAAVPEPLPAALELADRLDALGPGDAAPEESDEVRAARERLEAAKAAVEAAAIEREDNVLTPEDVAELEEVHAAREEAEAHVERSRIHLPGARRRLVAAQKAERAVLDRLGLPSYGAFLIRASTMLVPSEVSAAAKQAAADLAAAEAAWAEVAPPSPERAAAEREEAAAAARALLGDATPENDADLVVALRAHTVATADPSGPAGDLVVALERVGESASADDPEALADRARRWLGEGPLRAERAAALEEERAQLDAGVAAAEEALERARTDHQAALDAATRDLDEARTAEDGARRALEAATGRAAAAATAELDRRAAAVAIAEAALAAARAEAERARAAAPPPPSADDTAQPATVDDLEVWFLSRLTGLRAPSCTGPAPVVLDDALAGLPDDLAEGVLRVLERAAASHQVVYVGDDDRVRRWAGALGADVAKLT